MKQQQKKQSTIYIDIMMWFNGGSLAHENWNRFLEVEPVPAPAQNQQLLCIDEKRVFESVWAKWINAFVTLRGFESQNQIAILFTLHHLKTSNHKSDSCLVWAEQWQGVTNYTISQHDWSVWSTKPFCHKKWWIWELTENMFQPSCETGVLN